MLRTQLSPSPTISLRGSGRVLAALSPAKLISQFLGLDPIGQDRRFTQVFDHTVAYRWHIPSVRPRHSLPKDDVMRILVATLIVVSVLGIPAKLRTMMTTSATGDWFDTSRDNRFWGR